MIKSPENVFFFFFKRKKDSEIGLDHVIHNQTISMLVQLCTI